MKSRFFISLVASFFFLSYVGATASAPVDRNWSSPVNGLQVRLTLVQENSLYGTRWLVPYLELRNVRDLGNQMEVNCDSRHLTVEVVDAKGGPVRSGWTMSRSGPSPELNTVILPWHSAMTLSLENRNWGIPKNASAMVSTDSGAWVLKESEKGNVFLRATLTEEPLNPSFNSWKRWHGEIQTPLVEIDWK